MADYHMERRCKMKDRPLMNDDGWVRSRLNVRNSAILNRLRSTGSWNENLGSSKEIQQSKVAV
jgi:hypothetical protein